jgi:hypothetical protein
LKELTSELGLPLPPNLENDDFSLKCLKEFVVKKIDNTEVVTLEDFGKILEWFGPLEAGSGVLSRMQQLLVSKY